MPAMPPDRSTVLAVDPANRDRLSLTIGLLDSCLRGGEKTTRVYSLQNSSPACLSEHFLKRRTCLSSNDAPGLPRFLQDEVD
jgi:hypothetical protein